MSKEKDTTIKLTLPELHDLRLLLCNWEQRGFFYGRRDYFYKHINKVIKEVNNATEYLERQ